jgi:branched-chain amino acid transport system permease protein
VAWTGIAALAVVVVFALFPYYVYAGTTAILVQAFVILTLASMWNLLAGYAGLVSVGQQAFLGLGAYFVLILAMHGVSPFIGLPLGALGAGVAALPLWWLVSRLRTGYFAIGTWVLATGVALFVEQFQSIGGGTGMPMPGLSGFGSATLLSAYTYWAGLIVSVLALAGVYFLLRSRVGLVLTAIRDDEGAARSSGARVWVARMLVFVVAAIGCGAAGGVLAIEQLQVVPGTSGGVFSVQWTAEMAFAVIIGGIGTIEGPIIGTIVYMVLQQTLQQYNVWYLIVLGLVAIAITLFARKGIWGLADDKLGLRLFPVGYYLWSPSGRRGRKPAGLEVAAAEVTATVVEAAAVPAAVGPALVISAVVVAVAVVVACGEAFLVAVFIAALIASVAVEQAAAPTEDVGQDLRADDAAADPEGELAGPGQEAATAALLLVGLLIAVALLVRAGLAVSAIARLRVALPGLAEPGGRATALEPGAQLPDGGLLRHERLRHLVDQPRRRLLDMALDQRLSVRVPWPRLLRGPVQVLEQLIDRLLVLLVHPTRLPAGLPVWSA